MKRTGWIIVSASGFALFFASLFVVIGQESKPLPNPPMAARVEVKAEFVPILYPCRVFEVHDVDSIRAKIELGFDVELCPKELIRLAGFDGWEVTRARERVVGKITDEEIAKGKIARDALEKLIKEAEATYLRSEDMGREAHGRVWASLFIKQKGKRELLEVSRWAKENGHDRNGREKQP